MRSYRAVSSGPVERVVSSCGPLELGPPETVVSSCGPLKFGPPETVVSSCGPLKFGPPETVVSSCGRLKFGPPDDVTSGRPAPAQVQVLAVVPAVGTKKRRLGERGALLGVAAHQLQRPAQAEERVVVRRRVVVDRLELLGRLAVAARAEERPAERLPDRGFVGL